MLKLNSQAAQVALAQSSDSWLGGGVREATESPVASCAGQLPHAGVADDYAALQEVTLEELEAQDRVEQAAADEPLAQPADVEQAPRLAVSVATPPEAIPEQWLLGMFGQRAVQVEARDGESVRALDDSQPAVPASAALGYSSARAALPMAALSGARETVLSPAADVAGTVLAQGPVSTADPFSGRAAPQCTVLEPLASPPKIMGEVAASKVVALEPLDAQLLAQLERLSGQVAAAPSEAGSANVGTVQTAPGLDRSLKLQAPEVKWGEQMLHALRETVELQLQQRVQHTTIRLDPPELGSLEIFLSHESGRLSVHISAAQGDVARMLQQTSERLRHELVGQNFMQVSVQVSSDGQSGQSHERQARPRLFDEEAVMANSLKGEQSEQGPASPAGDVLITV